MRNNPFESSVDEKPLAQDLCQRIHFEALERAMGGCRAEAVPSTVDMSVLRRCVRLLGRETCLYHPEAIEQLFAGVSTAVYRMIAELYCCRLERSIGATAARDGSCRCTGRRNLVDHPTLPRGKGSG
jgi:hypothetical protein